MSLVECVDVFQNFLAKWKLTEDDLKGYMQYLGNEEVDFCMGAMRGGNCKKALDTPCVNFPRAKIDKCIPALKTECGRVSSRCMKALNAGCHY